MNQPPRPRLQDVADLAGVSLKTASRVLNDEPGVLPATSERVRAAAGTIGFRFNSSARSLKTGRTTLVGLIVQDLGNAFYGDLADGVEEVLRTHGLQLVIASAHEHPLREREAVTAMLGQGVNALLLVSADTDHAYLEREAPAGTPLVFLDRPPIGLDADSVMIDNRAGARGAVAHLLAGGHRRIGFLGDAAGNMPMRERRSGYEDALAASGIAVDPRLIANHKEPSSAEAALVAARLLGLADPPTAIFAANNRNTIGTIRAILALGRRLAIVGFDDFEFADLVRPAISVVRFDPRELGREAARIALARLAGSRGSTRTIAIPTELVVRGSGEVTRDETG